MSEMKMTAPSKSPPRKRKRVGRENDGTSRSANMSKFRRAVHFKRNPMIEAQRSQLPVYMHEQEIIEAVRHHDAVVVTGATGSGKTTQVPQFLLEEVLSRGRDGLITVTQPRRVAAVACARRVAEELGEKQVGNLVGYHVRHNANVHASTRLKFVTDGVLLREVEHDLMLSRYACVVVDEAHERSLNTDLLLALLSRTLPMRRASGFPLTLVIMSATLDVDGIVAGDAPLFPSSPVIAVPARQHPVTVHFARETKDDYVAEAISKTRKIHTRLPPGHVLIFVSGRREVLQICAQLERELGNREVRPEGSHVPLRALVLPFYALLPDAQQARVFTSVGENIRKIVVATNVAETSVTIPNVTYVVDSGKVKELSHSGLMSAFNIAWTSKASAEQRTGRAGRTGPGHCYRLYSSAVFDQQFASFKEPEVLRVRADAVVLRLRALGIIHVDKFPFPSRPEPQRLIEAQRVLEMLGALQSGSRTARPLTDIDGNDIVEDDTEVLLGVTGIGRELAKIPAPPRFARMALAASAHPSVFPLVCRTAALLSVGSVLERASKSQATFAHTGSDVITQLRAVCAADKSGWIDGASKRDQAKTREFCSEHAMHFKTLMEVLATSDQLEESVYNAAGQKLTARKGYVSAPRKAEEKLIIRAMLCGLPDQIARRLSPDEAAAYGVPPRWRGCTFVADGCKEPVFLPSSSAVRLNLDSEYVIFGKLLRSGHEKRESKNESKMGTENLEPKEEADEYVESEGDDEVSMGNCRDDDSKWNLEAEAEQKGRDADAGDSTVGDMRRERKASEERLAKRVLMENVSVVCASWVASNATAFCKFSLRMSTSARSRKSVGASDTICSYDSARDSVMVAMSAKYGGAKWSLGVRHVRYRSAISLLEGEDAEERSVRAVRNAACAAFAGAIVARRVAKLSDGLEATKLSIGVATARLIPRDITSAAELDAQVQDVPSFLRC